ncbi:hypothetical protein AcV5_000102 [Taiwanofungus camphoratus]|nr:hypothetical protein AcV5_000102 [Antrodia cinnamomea]KAI0945067.1 hypothetical protein AcV7_001700 [Antrodia cinnamomea]
MSDAEGGKKSGYRFEYAPSSRGKCKGPKPCSGTIIEKGELKAGTLVEFKGMPSWTWRHWGCVTPKLIQNMKNVHDEADDVDGFEDLHDDDQDRIRKAWEEGHVANEDIPESARKQTGEDSDDDDEEKPKKRGTKNQGAEADGKSAFKFEYASSGRSKCKACGETVGKDFFRLGNEVDFRGKKSHAWRHWGCTDAKMITSMKASYSAPSQIEGFAELKEGEQGKVQRAWDAGAVPEEDQGVGEAVAREKKAPARRKKKEEDGEEGEKPKRARAKKAKKDEDEDGDEEKPKKKRAPAKKDVIEKKGKAPAKKRASKKRDEDEESGEDFGDELAAVGVDDEEEEEEDQVSKKRKRAPASKASASKPPSKKARPASSRTKKQEVVEESDEDDYD